MNSADIAIIGGGIAGLSAAIYTAEAGFSTVVFDQNKSQLRPIEHVQNYPGFPEAITGDELLSRMRKQAESFGAELKKEKVAAVKAGETNGSRFLLTVADAEGNERSFSANYVIAASNINKKPLEDLGIETEVSPAVPSGKISRIKGGSWSGETNVPGFYVAGLLSGVPTQSIIAAGQGTQTAMEIISKEKGKAHVWHDS
ncbi:NAD(P)/FAD-dependent oxidoreductase [Salisediminibacterium halotolerans]|uniref:Pyridine nucleotide-disulphide oxidoreductase n=1 Tax=Salisediminibacterium halotolerans TaxID=517425 RepID=A0A1H9VW30_9BACI|nr:FAD-dependent oxidoreductase [Salisediminibacterium haloalkalitolerans]SES25503.1 Pyridine nucleotide-disulphide oxidoreductase [Salisediminibacterium haloalkalitolerans]